MSCTVYCLVPHPEQLDTVVEQLKGAGVETRDVAVVPRPNWRWPNLCASPSTSWRAAEVVIPDIWSLPFAFASLWWWPQWAAHGGDEPTAPDSGSCGVIPLAQYEARLKTNPNPMEPGN